MRCENCNEDLEGKQKFCSNCGQKNIAKLNVKYLLGEFLSAYLNFDSKLFRTLKFLITKPGFLSKEYVSGRRVHYLPPVRLYIVLSLVFFFLISLVNFHHLQKKDVNDPVVNFSIGDGESLLLPITELKQKQFDGTLNHYIDSITANKSNVYKYLIKKSVKSNINEESFEGELLNQISLFLLLFMPILALLYAAFFRRNKKGFVGHLIFNLHFNSFVLISILFGLIINKIAGNEMFERVSILIIAGLVQLYLIRSIMVFYNRTFGVALYKYILLILGYLFLSTIFLLMVISASLVMT